MSERCTSNCSGFRSIERCGLCRKSRIRGFRRHDGTANIRGVGQGLLAIERKLKPFFVASTRLLPNDIQSDLGAGGAQDELRDYFHRKIDFFA